MPLPLVGFPLSARVRPLELAGLERHGLVLIETFDRCGADRGPGPTDAARLGRCL